MHHGHVSFKCNQAVLGRKQFSMSEIVTQDYIG